jgi:predicted nucleic acid-binding Zn ribbon protein
MRDKTELRPATEKELDEWSRRFPEMVNTCSICGKTIPSFGEYMKIAIPCVCGAAQHIFCSKECFEKFKQRRQKND